MTATTADDAGRWTNRPGGMAQAGMLILLLALCAGTGLASSVVTRPAVATWYQDIAKPPWTPPDLAFPIVWAGLYVLMAFAAWQAWRSATHAAAGALVPFLIQLALNAAWPYTFFGLKNFDLGFVVTVALAAAVLATTVAFAQRSRLAAWLMVPYCLWVIYAMTVNAGVVWLGA
jgi:tryptophan-rich sensory protein